jgi:hypothetical protein
MVMPLLPSVPMRSSGISTKDGNGTFTQRLIQAIKIFIFYFLILKGYFFQ